MVKSYNGKAWFCCPQCGKKIHPVKPGARGVLVKCSQRLTDGRKCGWEGEIKW